MLGHELVHAFQYDITGTNVSSGSASAPWRCRCGSSRAWPSTCRSGPSIRRPRCGCATRRSARQLPDVEQLDNPKYFPYRYGQALWAYIGGKYGDAAVGNMLRAAASRDATYDGAIKEVLRIDSKQLTQDWHNAEFEAFRPIAESTKMPASFARSVISSEKPSGELNVGPELSPDGSSIIYFSERDMFSIDLFVADAKTGKVIKKVTNTATNSHYESLSFLTSAGAWDPAGKRFAFGGLSKGEPVLTIVDVDRGKTEREIKLKDLNEILNPAWSPDGKQIVFSGMVGGFTDLFLYDLSRPARTTRRRCGASRLMPLPRSIRRGRPTARRSRSAPIVSRPISRPSRPASCVLRRWTSPAARCGELGGFDNAKNISPQWAADGRSLYFVSDRQGISNIYRMKSDRQDDTADEHADRRERRDRAQPGDVIRRRSAGVQRLRERRLQHLRARIRGAAGGGAVHRAAAQCGSPAAGARGRRPCRRGAGRSDLGTAQEHRGRHRAAKRYKPDWSLDFVGQPSFGVGVDPFGTYATGGISIAALHRGHAQSRRDAISAPCASAASLAQTTSGSTPRDADVDAEAAVDAGHDVVAADEVGVALDALRDELRVLDVVRLALDDAGDQHLAFGHLDLLEQRPLVRMARIGGLEQDRVRLGLPDDVDDVGERHVAVVRAGVVAPAQVHAHLLGGDVTSAWLSASMCSAIVSRNPARSSSANWRVAAHREVGAIDLQHDAGLGDRLVLVAHRLGDGEHVVLVAGVVVVAEEEWRRRPAKRRSRTGPPASAPAHGLLQGDHVEVGRLPASLR